MYTPFFEPVCFRLFFFDLLLGDTAAATNIGIYATEFFLTALLFGWSLYLYYKLYEFIFKKTGAFGYSSFIRLFNLAIGLYFSYPLFRLLLLPGRLFSRELTFIINQSNSVKAGVAEVLRGAWEVFSSELVQFKEKELSAIAIGTLILVVTSFFINKVFYDGTKYGTEHLSPTLKNALTLAGLLLASSFFWLAAIIAIPYIQAPKTDATYSVLKLDSLLNSYDKDTITGVAPLLNNANDALNNLITYKDQVESKDSLWVNVNAQTTYNQNITNIKGDANLVSQRRSAAISQFNQLLQEFYKKKQDYIDEIKLRYQSVDKNLSPGVEGDYFFRLAGWFKNFINDNKEFLSSLRENFVQADKNLSIRSQSLLASLPAFRQQLQKAQDSLIKKGYYNQYFEFGQTYNFDYLVSSAAPWNYTALLPEPEKPGADWSFIGAFASWLITPHSMDVIMIAGMLGFGMFGASLSTVIVQTGQGTPNSFASNLMRVVLKGFAAAIIIFLASKAGIAAFNNGSNDPNPYVLFFTCMGGAIFSDRIWDWVKSHISSPPSGGGGNSGNSGGAGGNNNIGGGT